MANKKQNEQELQQAATQGMVENAPIPSLPPEMALEPVRPKKKIKKGKIIGFGIAIVLVLGIVGNTLYGAIKGPAPTYVEVQPAEIGNVQQVLSTSGTLETGEQVTIYSLVSAPLTGVDIKLGSSVQAGQLMFSYDTKDLERNYRQTSASSGLASLQAQAARDASKDSQQTADEYQASVNNLIDQRDIAQGHVTDATTQLEQLQQNLAPVIANAQAELDALRGIAVPTDADVARMVELEKVINEAKGQLEAAAGKLSAAQQDVTAQKSMLSQVYTLQDAAKKGVLNANGQKQTQLTQVPAAVAFEMAKDNLHMAQQGVLAPMNGVVTSLSTSAGSMAAQYSPLCVIESLDKVDVAVQLSRYDLERVQVGQTATVKTLGKEYAATVTKIDAMATKTVSTTGSSSFVKATVSLTNPDPSIVLGLEASVVISTGEASNVVTVPIAAINTDVEGTYCFVVEDGVAHRRTVTLGISSDTAAAVTEGLQEGDVVILSSQNIMEGTHVSSDPANAPAKATGFTAGVS